MVYKRSRLDEIAFQKQFEEALNLAMHHIGVNYSEALELVFTPLREQGGSVLLTTCDGANYPKRKEPWWNSLMIKKEV